MMGGDAVTTLHYNEDDRAYSDEEAQRDILDFTDGLGANEIIVATSDLSAIGFAQKIASRSSRINIFAGKTKGISLSLDPNRLHYNQITITGQL